MKPEIAYAYSLLDVTPEVSDKEMRTAWRKLVRKYHPDLAKTDPEEAARRMADINAAFDALSHHRAQGQKAEAPQQDNTATYQRQRRDARARKAAHDWRDAKHTRTTTQEAPKAQKPRKPAQTAVKVTAKWSRAEQTLINTARATFEGTRSKLNNAARRPAFSACA